MDTKVTLSFDDAVVIKAKQFAESHNISLSRLTEYLLHKVTSGHYQSLEEMPVANWINMLAEGEVEYKTRTKSRKSSKDEYFASKK